MRLTKYGETDLPELNGVHDLSQNARANLINLKYGAIDLDGTETVLNYKQISASAVINTDFDNTMDDLAFEAQKGSRILKSELRDGTERQLLAKMTTFSRNAKADKYTCEQEYGFQWNATYPYWLATADEPYYSNHGLTTADGLNTSDGDGRVSSNISSASTSLTITNNSRVRIPKIKFIIRASGTSGQWNNIRITNTTNQHYLEVDRSMVCNSTITRQDIYIDCLTKKIFGAYSDNSNNAAQYNLYPYVTINPDKLDWMIFEPGDNNLTVTSTFVGGSISRTMITYFSKHYV